MAASALVMAKEPEVVKALACLESAAEEVRAPGSVKARSVVEGTAVAGEKAWEGVVEKVQVVEVTAEEVGTASELQVVIAVKVEA